MNRRRPLYQGKGVAGTVSDRPSSGHAGLWFDKFFDRWSTDWQIEEKLEWIQTVANGKPVGLQKQIDEYVRRLVRLIRRHKGRFCVFETESRFVTGLGRSHPIENGFAWHPTLGTPYLPGSSVKGVVRTWAITDAEPRPSQEIVNRVFGTSNASGTVCFLDAIPAAPVKLEADVLTPHYANWTLKNLPGDWCSPTPIPFLTTAARNHFLFSVIPHSNDTGSDLKSVFDWLKLALKCSGAGAKTAVGYGRFRRDDEATRGLENWFEDKQERKKAMETPEGRWRLKLKNLSETDLLDKVRVNLEKERIEDGKERRAFAEAVWATGFPKHWRSGRPKTSTNVGAKKLKQRAQQVEEARTSSQL